MQLDSVSRILYLQYPRTVRVRQSVFLTSRSKAKMQLHTLTFARRHTILSIFVLFQLFSLSILTGCDEDLLEADGMMMLDVPDMEMMDEPQEPLAIIGSYDDEYMTAHEISAELWSQESADGIYRFEISSYDNEERWLVAQNSEENAFSAGLWSRFDWIEDGTGVWYCQIRFDAVDEDEAMMSMMADAGDLMGMGCNGFPWTRLDPR